MDRQAFNFNTEFERQILAALIAEPDKFYCRGDLLQPEYFSGVPAILTMRCLVKYQRQYSRLPTWATLRQLLTDAAEDTSVDVNNLQEFVTQLAAQPTGDTDFIVDRVVQFCRERATINAVRKVAQSLRDGGLPEEGFTKWFEDALAIGENLDDLGYVLHHSVDSVVDKVMAPSFGVRTGWPQFDNIWRTGWAPGWLIVPLAPPKRYKTTVSINLALNVAGFSVGEDVIYYACEISQEEAAIRAFCNLSGLNQDFMYDSAAAYKEAVKTAISQKIAGNLIFKHFPIGTASMGDLRAHTRLLRKQLGIQPRLIVIDYADTIRISDPSQPPHVQQASVYKEAIALGKESGAAVWMPDRCTADTVDKKVPDMRSFQGAFAKGGILDVAIGLCSTPAEYARNILRFFVFFNRYGPAGGYFQGSVDPELSRVSIGEPIPYNPDEEEEERPRRRGGNGGNPLPPALQD